MKSLTWLSCGLAEAVPASVSEGYFLEPDRLVERLISLAAATQQHPYDATLLNMGRCSFSVLLQSCLSHPRVWESFKSSSRVPPLLRWLLIECSAPPLREAVARTIKSMCCAVQTHQSHDLPNQKPAPADPDWPVGRLLECPRFFWDCFVGEISLAATTYGKNVEFFLLANETLQQLDSTILASLSLSEYVRDWGQLLLQLESQEVG
jgi:hypothetical protein